MKKKVSLQELKVESFVTDFKPETANTVKGGKEITYYCSRKCPTQGYYTVC
ncbi:MAG: pinensin family lanthipeptide [Cyclobacteriaceae bacterium]